MRVLILCILLTGCASINSPYDVKYHRSSSFEHEDHKNIECNICHNIAYRADSFYGIKLSCINCHK